MLRIRNLRKTYPSGVQALKGVNLDIPPGMFGLLGPNGSGKTTIMKILATLLEPDSGSVELDGDDLLNHQQAVRRILGYLPQEFGLYPVLTAEQTLGYFARLKGIMNAKERRALVRALLERVNLASESARKVSELSGGMIQRLGIAQALIGQPRLIVVDEPTAGLDPEERARFNNLLSDLAGENTTILLSTHIVADVSNLCERMAIIRHGEIVASCTPQEALDAIAGAVWETTVSREQAPAVRSSLRVLSVQAFEGRVRLRVYSEGDRPGGDFVQVAPTLEDYYLSRAGRAAGVG